MGRVVVVVRHRATRVDSCPLHGTAHLTQVPVIRHPQVRGYLRPPTRCLVPINRRNVPAIIEMTITETASKLMRAHDFGYLQSKDPRPLLPKHRLHPIIPQLLNMRHSNSLILHSNLSKHQIRVLVL